MHSPILPMVHIVNNDRIAEAEAVRLARSVVQDRPQQPQRRIRSLAARLSFAALR
jgi:hypothetical protein